MKITCPECGFSATIDPAGIPANGITAGCPKCSCRFRIDPPRPPEPALVDSLLIICPSCSHEQLFAADCSRCGVIFARYRPPEERKIAALPVKPAIGRKQLLRYAFAPAAVLLGLLLFWIFVKDLLPTTITTIHETLSVTSGLKHSVAVRSDGSVWSWGENGHGQLGNGRRDAGHGLPWKVPGLEGFTAVAAGERHTLALKKDGTVWSWGDNEFGQLGDDSGIVGRTEPARITGLSGIVAIAAGDSFSVALKDDGTVWHFGYGFLSLITNGGTWLEYGRPQQIAGLADVAAVTCGRRTVVALKKNGTVWCAGENLEGQCGNDTVGIRPEPGEMAGLVDVVAIAAGEQFTLALKKDGTVWGWGTLLLAPGKVMQRRHSPEQIPGLGGVSDIKAGYWRALALKSNGTVWSSGGESVRPGEKRSFGDILKRSKLAATRFIFAGGRDAFLEKSDGSLYCWGLNNSGQPVEKGNPPPASLAQLTFDLLAEGSIAEPTASKPAVPELQFQSIAAGSVHSLALAKDGTVWAWGENESGQIASRTTGSSSRPQQVFDRNGRPMSQVTAIAAGSLYSLAIKADGTLWLWGQDMALPQYVSSSRTGYKGEYAGTSHNAILPTMIEGVNDAVAVAGSYGGNPSFVVLHANGALSCFGKNDLDVPLRKLRPLDGVDDVTAISAGARHVAALKRDGTVWTWGNNDSGQLGDGTRNQRLYPGRVAKLKKAVRIAAGGGFTMAVKSDGTVWGWGGSIHARLPSGLQVASSLDPVQIHGLADIVEIAVPGNGYANGSHFLALDRYGHVWSWGYNGRGQLGQGTINYDFKKTPAKIENLDSVNALAAGLMHGLALRQDGTVISWGGNSAGQLGNGTGFDSAFPVAIISSQVTPGKKP
jgi:alpha-tubulin suppressor-like RCC1 family protein